jgi:hypothetical protein
MSDISGPQKFVPSIDQEAQLAERRGHIVAPQILIRMIQVPHKTPPGAPKNGSAAHQTLAHDGTADAGLGAQALEVAGAHTDRGARVVCGRTHDDVHGAADGIPSVQRSLWTAKDFDALDVQKIREHHGRPCQVDAVQIHRRAGIRSGKDGVRADAANGELCEASVLRERDRRRQPRHVLDVLNLLALEFAVLHHGHGDWRVLRVTVPGLPGRHHRLFGKLHPQRQRHRQRLPAGQMELARRWRETRL